ncbi:MAG TPA: BON domain-containing protein [Gemmatimonadaceae bacterium]|nr:BON domain-containing protein [Gemmatimonadaceae bacterium]
MKRDTELQQNVMAELKWEPSIKAAQIGVAVTDGVVTLTGTVDTFAQKYAAERAAERVSGVRAIAEDLHVMTPGEYNKTDPEIARAAANALLWDVEVPQNAIKVVVRNGWVTLEGAVSWYYEKASAERAVRYLTGVKGVINLIDVRPAGPQASDVKAKIEAALKRNAELDARRIQVEADGGIVTLRGEVRSFIEREDAERAAWAAPGVRIVKDELKLAL